MTPKGKKLGPTAARNGSKVIARMKSGKTGFVKTVRDDVARHSGVKTAPVAAKARVPAHITYLDKAIARAKEVLGGRDEALRWLGTPVAGLGYATPITLLGTKGGLRRVDDLLTQIEHGIW